MINHEYEFDGQYIDDKPLYTNEIIRLIDLTVITKEMLPKIKKDIDLVVKRILDDDEKRVKLGKHCQLKKMRECIYKDLCYDRPNTAFAYTLWYHPRRINTFLSFFLDKVIQYQGQELIVFDLGAGAGAIIGAATTAAIGNIFLSDLDPITDDTL